MHWLRSDKGELINVRHIHTINKVERISDAGERVWVWIAIGKNESFVLDASDDEIQKLTSME
jgi:hypothetical protein